MHKRLHEENGDVLQVALLLIPAIGVIVIGINMVFTMLPDLGLSGVIVSKNYHEAVYSNDFSLGERKVITEAEHIVGLDTNDDGKQDEEVTVSAEEYANLGINDEYNVVSSPSLSNDTQG